MTVRKESEGCDVVLELWCIRETDAGTRHFVGYNIVDGEGRVSTPIVEFDPVTGTGVTSNGSRYQLVGRAGQNRDAEYLLGDSNRHLIDLYSSIVHALDELIAATSRYFVEEYRSKERYLEVRSAFNQEQDLLERSAQFLYLNRFGFNGLCRYNRSGEFNVPYGNPTRVPRLPVERLVAFREKAASATFVAGDFISVMQQAVSGDIVYCDPPYLDRDSAGKSFTGYGASGFGFDRQEELASMARTLAGRGIPVLISNHDCDAAWSIYEGAQLFQFQARRSISADASRRGTVPELLAFFDAC